MPFFISREITLKTGLTVYVSMEEVTAESLTYWRWYLDTAELFSNKIIIPFLRAHLSSSVGSAVWKSMQETFYREIFTTERYEAMKAYLLRNQGKFSKKAEVLFLGLKDAMIGFHHALPRTTEDSKQRYVVYVTTSPLATPLSDGNKAMLPPEFNQAYGFTNYAIRVQPGELVSDFINLYSNLAISMAAITASDSRSITHMGIFKNPMLFISPQGNKYSSLTAVLHGFAADTAATMFGKKLQINQPTPLMLKRLESKLPEEAITLEEEGISGENHCPVRAGPVAVIPLHALATLLDTEICESPIEMKCLST